MAGPAWMSKVSAGRAAGARGGGPEAVGTPWPARAACGQPALQRGDDQGEGGARPCSRRFPPGPSPGPASGRTVRGWAGSAPTAGPPGSAGRGRGHLAGRGRRAGEVPWGAPGRFLPGLPAPRPPPGSPGSAPAAASPPKEGHGGPAPWGSHRDPRRGKPAAPHLFGGEPAPWSVGALTAGMPGPGGAPTIPAAAAGLLGGARQPRAVRGHPQGHAGSRCREGRGSRAPQAAACPQVSAPFCRRRGQGHPTG